MMGKIGSQQRGQRVWGELGAFEELKVVQLARAYGNECSSVWNVSFEQEGQGRFANRRESGAALWE